MPACGLPGHLGLPAECIDYPLVDLTISIRALPVEGIPAVARRRGSLVRIASGTSATECTEVQSPHAVISRAIAFLSIRSPARVSEVRARLREWGAQEFVSDRGGAGERCVALCSCPCTQSSTRSVRVQGWSRRPLQGEMLRLRRSTCWSREAADSICLQAWCCTGIAESGRRSCSTRCVVMQGEWGGYASTSKDRHLK